MGTLLGFRWYISIAIVQFMCTPILGAASQCYVDLDDQDIDSKDHNCQDLSYTKTRDGVEYNCTSMQDHCCTDEQYCCNAAAEGKGTRALDISDTTCIEDESGNTHESNCGFRMLCCKGVTPKIAGECVPHDGAMTYRLVILFVLVVAACGGIIGMGIGMYCCYVKKRCCWQPSPSQPKVDGPCETQVTVVGQPVVASQGKQGGWVA